MILLATLLLASAFAGWSWFRPYEWNADPAARGKIMGTLVKKDESYFWVDVHFKILPGQTHDLLKPVRLKTGAGREIEPAETTLAGDDKRATTDVWFKFWLDQNDIKGPLALRINDGTLTINAGPGIPDTGPTNSKYFPTQHW